ncbi:hypothetical protein N0V88_005971 [Collariella sp. IMI 366227]|nr:hypothetical protein N0V88_005971 [Collariella sp. IMI 366227]
MGIIKRALLGTGVLTGGVVGYLGAATTIISPIPKDDPLWASKSYAKYNLYQNPSTQDLCVKRIPLSKIKPELLQREGDLALEFCRGVWSGLGYRPQRLYLARKYQGPATASQLWTVSQLSQSTYEPGTQLTDHFEVVEKTPSSVVVRCGDTPRNSRPRDSDGLFVVSATVDEEREEAVLALKSCFFKSSERVEGILGPMPGWVEEAHRWYSRHNLHEAVVNLTTDKVETNAKLGPFTHANGDGEEIIAVEKALLAHPDVQAEIAKLKLPEGTVVVSDPWIYGSDGVKDGTFYDDKRVMQCFLYMRDPKNPSEPDSCHYAFPLPISPVIDPMTLELVRIDILPTGHDEKVKPLARWEETAASEYIPEAQTLRTDLKPLRVVQPEGVSFTVENFSEMGRLIRWQKWDLKVGFNQREGMVLYDVHYDNKPLFYRLSLSDMSIPYADPRHPFHRKAAFDLGDAGAGIMANNLQLGCDCLGSIYYIHGFLSDSFGKPVRMPNVICVHEQDGGILWKHTNYRTNRAVAVRNRELVLQTILTVSNYEYILSFIFNTAGDVTYEARATGILSTQPLDLSLTTTPHPFGTVVHPGVLGAFHQHFFSSASTP